MNAVRKGRGLALLAAHCLSLDPDTQTARQRLDATIGPELAHMLVAALSSERAASTGSLRARAIFAA